MRIRNIKYTNIIACLSLIAFSGVSPTYADTATENMDLARISHILDATYPVIEDAKKQADENQRLKFHYEWLKKDIQAIQAGIAQKIKQDRIEPRVIAPLKTNLTTERNGHS